MTKNTGRVLGYARVSSKDQNLARQTAALLAAGVPERRIYAEHVSGKNTERPELRRLLDDIVTSGDTLVVHSFDRLARNLDDLRAVIKRLVSEGVTVKFLTENLTFEPGTDDSMSWLMLSLMGSVAEFERRRIAELRDEGIAEARKRGVYKGRKPVSDDKLAAVRDLIEQGVPVSRACKQVGVSRSAWYRHAAAESAAE